MGCCTSCENGSPCDTDIDPYTGLTYGQVREYEASFLAGRSIPGASFAAWKDARIRFERTAQALDSAVAGGSVAQQHAFLGAPDGSVEQRLYGAWRAIWFDMVDQARALAPRATYVAAIGGSAVFVAALATALAEVRSSDASLRDMIPVMIPPPPAKQVVSDESVIDSIPEAAPAKPKSPTGSILGRIAEVLNPKKLVGGGKITPTLSLPSGDGPSQQQEDVGGGGSTQAPAPADNPTPAVVNRPVPAGKANLISPDFMLYRRVSSGGRKRVKIGNSYTWGNHLYAGLESEYRRRKGRTMVLRDFADMAGDATRTADSLLSSGRHKVGVNPEGAEGYFLGRSRFDRFASALSLEAERDTLGRPSAPRSATSRAKGNLGEYVCDAGVHSGGQRYQNNPKCHFDSTMEILAYNKLRGAVRSEMVNAIPSMVPMILGNWCRNRSYANGRSMGIVPPPYWMQQMQQVAMERPSPLFDDTITLGDDLGLDEMVNAIPGLSVNNEVDEMLAARAPGILARIKSLNPFSSPKPKPVTGTKKSDMAMVKMLEAPKMAISGNIPDQAEEALDHVGKATDPVYEVEAQRMAERMMVLENEFQAAMKQCFNGGNLDTDRCQDAADLAMRIYDLRIAMTIHGDPDGMLARALEMYDEKYAKKVKYARKYKESGDSFVDQLRDGWDKMTDRFNPGRQKISGTANTDKGESLISAALKIYAAVWLAGVVAVALGAVAIAHYGVQALPSIAPVMQRGADGLIQIQRDIVNQAPKIIESVVPSRAALKALGA